MEGCHFPNLWIQITPVFRKQPVYTTGIYQSGFPVAASQVR